jgi:hypothetical protein
LDVVFFGWKRIRDDGVAEMFTGVSASHGYNRLCLPHIGENTKTGEKRPCFITYEVFILYLGAWPSFQVAQREEPPKGFISTHAMLKAGCRGKSLATRLYYLDPISQF